MSSESKSRDCTPRRSCTATAPSRATLAVRIYPSPHQALLHGVHHVDRFLAAQSVPKEALQLVGAVSLMAACNSFCKLPTQDGERTEGERGLHSAEDIVYWTDNTYTTEEVRGMGAY